MAPCCYAIQGELSLGNLKDKPFDEIWNGKEARDLRRGMLCGDAPAHCSSCRFIDPIHPQTRLPLLGLIDHQLCESFRAGGNQFPVVDTTHIDGLPIETSLKILGPIHTERTEASPEFLIADPFHEIAEYWLALSLAGETDEVHSFSVEPTAIQGNIVRFELPDDVWQKLRTNAGYWWNIWAVPADEAKPILRSKKATCFIRHMNLVRIEGSKLKYTDRGALPVIDLGAQKQLGWNDSGVAPQRPEVEQKRASIPTSKTEPNSELVASDSETTADCAVPPGAVTMPPSLWKRIARSIKGSKKDPKSPLVRKGNPDVLDGYIDQVAEYPDYLHVIGWKLLQCGPADMIVFESVAGETTKASLVNRPDLEFTFLNVPRAADGGFEVKLRSKKFKTQYGYEFSIVAKRDGKEVSRVHVSRFITDDSGPEPNAGPFWFGRSDRLVIG